MARAFWLEAFGPEYPAAALTPGDVEEIARKAARTRNWSPATERRYLIYIGVATRCAFRKKRAIAENPLIGVSLPRATPETEGLDYSEAEVEALCTPDNRIDWRVTLAANIAADTGRRIGAIRHLQAADVVLRDGRFWLVFVKATDKGRKSSTVPVSAETSELILSALENDRVQRWGWLFPGQKAETPLGGKDATGSGTLGAMLHEAERVHGIPYVRGRAFLGIKRRHVTVSWEEAHGDAALVGDVTGNTSPDVLRKVYRRQSESRKTAQVDRVRARFGGGSDTGSDTRSNATKSGGS
jgi:integrase